MRGVRLDAAAEAAAWEEARATVLAEARATVLVEARATTWDFRSTEQVARGSGRSTMRDSAAEAAAVRASARDGVGELGQGEARAEIKKEKGFERGRSSAVSTAAAGIDTRMTPRGEHGKEELTTEEGQQHTARSDQHWRRVTTATSTIDNGDNGEAKSKEGGKPTHSLLKLTSATGLRHRAPPSPESLLRLDLRSRSSFVELPCSSPPPLSSPPPPSCSSCHPHRRQRLCPHRRPRFYPRRRRTRASSRMLSLSLY